MNRFNRYLVFYVILGVGLVLAWSQVGRRAQLAQATEVMVMTTEEDCRAHAAPCAAYAKNFALVAGPRTDGSGLLLVGEKLPSGMQVEVAQLDAQVRLMPVPLLRSAGKQRWFVEMAPDAARLRVNLTLAESQWIAEYPLQ